MDAVQSTLNRLTFSVQEAYLRLRSFDIHNVDWHNLNYAAILLGTIIAGILSIVVYAQFTPDASVPPPKTGLNWALGSESKATVDENAPPIPPPTEIISLRVYPIKSCRGFQVGATRLRRSGLTLDRNWMFVNKQDNTFMTIRQEASMTLIDTRLVETASEQLLEISIHGTDSSVQIPAFPSEAWLKKNTTITKVEIWGEQTDAYEYSEEINKPFSDFFNKTVALVFKGPEPRMVAVNGRKELYGSATPHHFADVMSLQVASEASIKDLNRRLQEDGADVKEPLTVERFRPNIIVRGRDDHPWEEDTWKRVRISTKLPNEHAIYKIDLDVVARCARCQVPNVNPDTAEKHPKQPWNELMKYRRVDQGGAAKYKPCFGMLCIPRNEGKIKVGATLEVLETTDKHLYNTAKFSDL